MKDPLSEYGINFVGLSVGEHKFSYELNDVFMDSFAEQDFNNVRVKAELTLNKKANLSMELDLKIEGSVEVLCDRTSKPFDMEISSERHVIVKLGAEWNDDDDEMLIIPNGEHELNVAQLYYELLVQSLPLKRLFPGLEEQEPEMYTSPAEETEMDPRWAELEALKQSQSD